MFIISGGVDALPPEYDRNWWLPSTTKHSRGRIIQALSIRRSKKKLLTREQVWTAGLLVCLMLLWYGLSTQYYTFMHADKDKDKAKDVGADEPKAGADVGKIVNLMSVDCNRVGYHLLFCRRVWFWWGNKYIDCDVTFCHDHLLCRWVLPRSGSVSDSLRNSAVGGNICHHILVPVSHPGFSSMSRSKMWFYRLPGWSTFAGYLVLLGRLTRSSWNEP